MTSMDTLVKPAELAESLGVSENTLRWWRHVGRGPKHVALTERVIRYRREDVDAWLEQCAADTADQKGA